MKSANLALTLVLAAGIAAARTKVNATGHCGKSDKHETVDVDDRAGHIIVLAKWRCDFTTASKWRASKARAIPAL